MNTNLNAICLLKNFVSIKKFEKMPTRIHNLITHFYHLFSTKCISYYIRFPLKYPEILHRFYIPVYLPTKYTTPDILSQM